MTDTVASMPGRPLKYHTVRDSDDFLGYAIREETREILALVVFSSDTAHALGYDEEAGGWEKIGDAPATPDTTEEDIHALDETVGEWVLEVYEEERLSGDVQMMIGEEAPDQEKQRPKEVEQGLEPEYDCPEDDCDWYATGLSTSPHAFLDHLREEHGYSDSEAHEVLNGE
ncbi:hypothetical protein [Halobacterium wangiae]|uniref:hypothetical protein n=1 Tax=Halobacterium wangiae TaxID=2902623 RepID=UPI001E6488F4|nr:hypothetical protein [Halobacterium wangiae]